MENFKFNCGVIVGRFSPIHIGHEQLINEALKDCRQVVVIVTADNISKETSYSLDYRIHLVNKVYSSEIKNNRLIVVPFVSNQKLDTNYGDEIFRLVKNSVHKEADYIIYGSDKNIEKCFSKDKINKLFCNKIDRNLIPISATMIRKMLKNNDKENLEKYLNICVLEEYDKLKNI